MKEKTATAVRIETDSDYAAFERLVAERGAAIEGPLFTTDAEGLWEAYLAGIPEAQRQHYNCNCCRRFIERYGGLVAINEDAENVPLMWDGELANPFGRVNILLWAKVRKARVTGVFLSAEPVWGTPSNVPGPPSKYEGVRWTHLSCANKNVVSEKVKTAEQQMAEKREEHHMLCRGLAEYPLEAIVQAVRVLEADAVDRSEKALGCAKWLLELHQRIEGVKGRQRDNLVWLAVATAPPGWCHVKSTMISTLLDDVVAELPYESIRRRWAEKMHPLQYQRPTTLHEGTVKQANELMEKLGATAALPRRFAKLNDLIALMERWEAPVGEQGEPVCVDTGVRPFIWHETVQVEDRTTEVKSGGAFDHLLKSKTRIKEVQLPPAKIAWEKFRELLPTARRIECYFGAGRQAFYGLVTAVDPTAPNLLQWDNPVSWYHYIHGSTPDTWSLEANSWVPVTAVFLPPHQWQAPERFSHFGMAVMFALEGCRDHGHKAGGGMFPECLKTEYHGVRQVIEAHMQGAAIAGKEDGDANGITLGKNDNLKLRVDGREYEVSL